MAPLPDVTGLPLWAQIVFVAAGALVYFVVHLGIQRGKVSRPGTSGRAEVAAVIVDSAALDRLTAAAEAMNVTIAETNHLARQHLEDLRVQRDEAELDAAEERGYQRGLKQPRKRRPPSRPRTKPTA